MTQRLYWYSFSLSPATATAVHLTRAQLYIELVIKVIEIIKNKKILKDKYEKEKESII